MNYLHRNLKPANFLIDKAGHIKLANFGLAKHKHAVEISQAEIEKRKKEEICSKQKTKYELRRELDHSIVGSPEYMSPEVTFGRHQGGSYYGEEADWWSLGCVFFEMILGAPPFTGDSVEEIFSEIDLWSQRLPKLFEDYKTHLSPHCYSLLTGFLCDPKHRLGSDINKIKSHPFFYWYRLGQFIINDSSFCTPKSSRDGFFK